MSEVKKATFGAEEKKSMEQSPKREDEIAVIWERKDRNGDKYISVKVKVDETKELNFKAFKNKQKKEGDAKPDYIGYKNTTKKEN